MTSEGQYAGQQPGATSGGGADPFGTDGFPPDLDGQQAADRAPSYPHAQESFPSAYGPPPHATPNGGSPFVVPAVPPAGQTPTPGSPAPQPPGPAFGPGAANFSSGASGSARVPAPEPGLPQRPPAPSAPGGAFPAPESAWAPPPSAQPSAAAEDNPFTPRAAESHPYRGGAGDLPQRSPGIAGGPLDGPVGDFNGFTPARKAAEPAPGPGPELSRRAPDEHLSPFDRPGTFGTPQYPADGAPAPFGSAAPQAFGSARPDDADGDPGRAPGVSAFGDQRIRVPGATLTGLPDSSPADGSGLPPRGSDAGGLPPRDGLGRSRGGSESGGFPLRGGTGNASFPIRGGPDSSAAGFSSRSGPVSGGALPARGDADSGGFAARLPDNDYQPRTPFAAPGEAGAGDGGAFPARGDAGGDPFGPRGGTDGFSTPGSSDSGGFPVRGAYAGPGDDGQSASARSPHPYGDRPGEPYGDRPGEPDGGGTGGTGYPQRVPGTSFAVAGSPDLNRPDGGSGGYAQRVPGAAFGSGGAPVVESRSAVSVPLPREKPERLESADSAAEPPGPAKGTARPVTASASVPVSSRVAPPPEAEELPPAQANPQSRVYGRPAPAEEAPAVPAHPYQDEDHSAGAPFGSSPVSGARRAAPTSGAMGAAPTPGAYSQTPENPQGEPYARASEDLYAPQAESPSAAPADGTYGRPAADGEGTYGRPAEAPFGARPSSGASGTSGLFDGQPDERTPFGAPPQDDPFARPSSEAYGNPPAGPFDGGAPEPGPAFGAAPASGSDHPPERASGRATASARVSPPGQPFAPSAPDEQPSERAAQAFSEFTADIAGRGQPVPGNPVGRTSPPDQYGEHTTDMAGRNQASDRPYVPAPALPSMHAAPPLEHGFPPATAPDSTQPFGERPRMGGVFPGPASRATVTPPGPEQTASWPSRQEPDAPAQGRFDSFKQDTPEVVSTVTAKPETPHVRMIPVILGVILGAGLLVGLTLGVTWLIARGSHDGGTGNTGFSVKAGDCVKRDGTAAVTASCTDPGSFEVTAIAATKEQCPDPNQPYVVNPTSGGGSQVLCLKPRS